MVSLDHLKTIKLPKTQPFSYLEVKVVVALNIPIIEVVLIQVTHNLAKSQSYQGLRLLLRDTTFMKTVKSRLIYHRFQEK
jgi:hypothetical protein